MGVILSDAPYSVYDIDSPHVDPDVFELGVPILGICYGLQVGVYFSIWEALLIDRRRHIARPTQEIAWNLGGKVAKCDYREYGSAHMRVNKFAIGGSSPTVNALFEGLGDEMKVRPRPCCLACRLIAPHPLNSVLYKGVDVA